MKYKGISIVPDSSVISRIVESPSERDSAEKKNRQDKSIGWFKTADEYRVLIPETAANEVATGVHENATKRIKLIRDLPRLAITPEIEQLAKALIDGGAFRPTAKKDALILATACFYGIDYLLTWNMQDLDNNKNKECMARIVQLYGYHLPIICSPKVFSDTHEETPKPEFTALNAEEKSVEDATVYYGKMSYNIDVMKGIDNMEDILHKGTSMPAAEKFALISEKICADFDKDARKVFNDVLGYDMDSGKKIICPVHIPRWAPKSLLSHRKRLKKGIVRSEVLKEIIGEEETLSEQANSLHRNLSSEYKGYVNEFFKIIINEKLSCNGDLVYPPYLPEWVEAYLQDYIEKRIAEKRAKGDKKVNGESIAFLKRIFFKSSLSKEVIDKMDRRQTQVEVDRESITHECRRIRKQMSIESMIETHIYMKAVREGKNYDEISTASQKVKDDAKRSGDVSFSMEAQEQAARAQAAQAYK